jgi:hypothetical protein
MKINIIDVEQVRRESYNNLIRQINKDLTGAIGKSLQYFKDSDTEIYNFVTENDELFKGYDVIFNTVQVTISW